MFNTFPSASVDEVETTLNAGVLTSVTLSNLLKYTDVRTYFNDSSTAQKQKFGPRYAWGSSGSLNTDWIDVINLTGPGALQFLTVWFESGVGGSAQDLRVMVDDVEVVEIINAWPGGAGINSGFILFGDVLWDDATHVPIDPPYALENMSFRTSFQLQVRDQAGASTKVFKALHRYYGTA